MDLDNDNFINHDEFEAAFEGPSILGCQAFNSECLPFRDGWGCVGLPKHDKKVQRLSLGCLNHEFLTCHETVLEIKKTLNPNGFCSCQKLGGFQMCNEDHRGGRRSIYKNHPEKQHGKCWFPRGISAMGPMFYVSLRKCNQFLPSSKLKIAGCKFSFSSCKFISKNGL